MANKAKTSTVDEEEVAKFSAMADEWWDLNGKFKPLHLFNPVRIKFLQNTIEKHFDQNDLEGISLLDVGCGGGLLSEPMAQSGAKVTGIDASEKNIKIASIHAEREEIDIDYRFATAEELVKEQKSDERNPSRGPSDQAGAEPARRGSAKTNQFDVVMAMEIIEHVADVPAFIESCCNLVKPGGLLFFATMNRTVKSYAFAIVGAEYVLRWLPKGTHDWNKFLRPSEIVVEAEKNNVKATKVQGVTYNPLNSKWNLSNDTDVNYMVVLEKQPK